jgi:hypothetical protein
MDAVANSTPLDSEADAGACASPAERIQFRFHGARFCVRYHVFVMVDSFDFFPPFVSSRLDAPFARDLLCIFCTWKNDTVTASLVHVLL